MVFEIVVIVSSFERTMILGVVTSMMVGGLSHAR